jgi:uncharacterized surface protein with fasciclin (FAS1) repeats
MEHCMKGLSKMIHKSIALLIGIGIAFSSLTAVASSDKSMDVVDMAAHTGQFNTLVQAIQAAELESVLRGEGPFTVFAPTDEAFAKLDPGTLENLLKPENKADLQAILTYHVIPGSIMSAEVTQMEAGKTVNGEDLTFRTEDGSVYVNNAKVIQADVQASNGVIHVIDTVLLP